MTDDKKLIVQVFTKTGIQAAILTKMDRKDLEDRFFHRTDPWVAILGLNQLGNESFVRVDRAEICVVIIEEFHPQLIAVPKPAPGTSRLIQ